MPSHDPVNKPKHYDLGNGLEVIDVRDVLLDKIEHQIALTYKQTDYWSRSWEYMTRFMDKGGIQDLKKAKFYLDRLINDFEKQENEYAIGGKEHNQD
jgi:hypothetical protein